MPRLRAGALLLGWLTCGLAVHAAAQPPHLRDEWVDPDTGHRVVRLSRVPGRSISFYFHQNAFTPQGDKMVFDNMAPAEGHRLLVLDLASRRVQPLTASGVQGGVVARHSRTVFYERHGAVYETAIDSGVTRLIARLPFHGSAATVNADGTLLAGTFAEPGHGPVFRGKRPRDWFEKIFEARRPQWLFTVDIATGQIHNFYRYQGWVGHVQFSPTDPTLLMFCHEGPWQKVDRIWVIRTDGSGLRLLHKRSIPMEIAGHEFWAPDGKTVWFDLQVPRGKEFYLAGVNLETGHETRYRIERDEWSVHYNISRDGKLFAGDGGAPNMVAHAAHGKWIYLFTPRADGALRAEKLVNMARQDYSLEPNVNFTPDGKWIVFRGNFDGVPQVYAVSVKKD